nr:hypothetical protein [Tanacetum cinerariifolium]
MQDKDKKSCMVSFRQLHSHLKRLSQNDLQGSQTESRFKCAFATLSCQDTETFTGTMFLNVEQLEKQLDKEDFQEIESMAAFNMQITEAKVDTSKALDASLVDIESNRTESKEQDTSNRSRNDAHADVADIRPIYDEELMAEEREAASAKPHHMIASSNSRISSKNMTKFSSNDMVHNHYLEEANKRIQERNRNSEPSLMYSARSQSTANGSKPMPRRNTQTSRVWPATKNSFVTTKTVPIAEHPRNSRNDSCVTKFRKEVNSCAKVPSNKTTNKNKPVEQISVPNKQER